MKYTKILLTQDFKENFKKDLNQSIQHSIIIGLLLGDGGLYKTSPESNARFEISFGSKYK